MSNLWWEHLSLEERLLAEQAVLQHRALREACAAAPEGKVLAIAERLALARDGWRPPRRRAQVASSRRP